MVGRVAELARGGLMYGLHPHSAYSMLQPKEPWLREDDARQLGAGVYWVHWVYWTVGVLVWC